MNDRSLRESNAWLSAAAARVEAGGLIPAPPADLAEEAGITDRLALARAVRALLARGRIGQEGERYRLLDGRPLEPGEPASVRRASRRRRAGTGGREVKRAPTYEDVGRAIIERLIELSAEISELRAALDRARGEAEAARREALDATREATRDRNRALELEREADVVRRRLQMTEANLRTVVEAARERLETPLEDSDARAVLDVLSNKDASG